MQQIFLILALVVAIVAVIFALQNPAAVTISLLFWQFQGSLALVLLIAVTLGVLISLLVSVPTVIRRTRSLSAQKKTIADLQSQLENREQRIRELEAGQVIPPAPPVEAPKPSLEPGEIPPFTPPDVAS